MKRFSLVAVAGAVALLAPLGAAASAQAAEQPTFTINEQIILGPDGPVLETFTSSSPLCPSGIFVDTVQTGPGPGQGPNNSGKLQLIVRSVYTCDDGSGSFNALKEITGNGITNTGPIQLLGGTGAFTNLSGHGVDSGIRTGDNTAAATDTGVVTRI